MERKKKAFEEAAEKTAALEADVTAEQAAIAKEISVADPYVKNAKDALHGIGQKEQQVLKGMKSPAIPVRCRASTSLVTSMLLCTMRDALN